MCLLQGCVDLSDSMGPIEIPGGNWGGFCDDSTPDPAFVGVYFLDAQRYVQLGDSLMVYASVLNGRCQPISIDLMSSWSSSNNSVATIEPVPPNGEVAIVRTRATGVASAIATAKGAAGSVEFQVIPRVATMVLNPATATLRVGDSIRVSPVAKSASGQIIPVVPVQYSYEQSPAVMMNFTDKGIWIYGQNPGTFTLQAQVFDLQSTAVITIVKR